MEPFEPGCLADPPEQPFAFTGRQGFADFGCLQSGQGDMGGAALVAVRFAGGFLGADEFVVDGINPVEGLELAVDFHRFSRFKFTAKTLSAQSRNHIFIYNLS